MPFILSIQSSIPGSIASPACSYVDRIKRIPTATTVGSLSIVQSKKMPHALDFGYNAYQCPLDFERCCDAMEITFQFDKEMIRDIHLDPKGWFALSRYHRTTRTLPFGMTVKAFKDTSACAPTSVGHSTLRYLSNVKLPTLIFARDMMIVGGLIRPLNLTKNHEKNVRQLVDAFNGLTIAIRKQVDPRYNEFLDLHELYPD